jgi:hypothetical protein
LGDPREFPAESGNIGNIWRWKTMETSMIYLDFAMLIHVHEVMNINLAVHGCADQHQAVHFSIFARWKANREMPDTLDSPDFQ